VHSVHVVLRGNLETPAYASGDMTLQLFFGLSRNAKPIHVNQSIRQWASIYLKLALVKELGGCLIRFNEKVSTILCILMELPSTSTRRIGRSYLIRVVRK